MAGVQCKFVVWFFKSRLVSWDSDALRKPSHVSYINVVGKRQTKIHPKMFDKVFCIGLELAITSSFKQSTDIEQRRCWCNGVVLQEIDPLYSIEQVLKTRQLIAKAWIDEGRGADEGLQYLYDMRLNFGDKSVDSLKTGDRLETCIPDSAVDSWISFDRQAKTIDLQLL